jgi:hypothetical protein
VRDRLGLPSSGIHGVQIAEQIKGSAVVLNCAGPFSQTAKPMMDACLSVGADYLDITGEIEVDDATSDDLTALGARVWHKPLSIEDLHEIARSLLTSASPAQSLVTPSRYL